MPLPVPLARAFALLTAHNHYPPPHPGLLNFVSFLTVLFFLPETNKGAKSADKKKGVCPPLYSPAPHQPPAPRPMFFNMARRGCAQSLREGLKVVLKDWLMSKLILASCLGSFCNGGLLVAMVLFYSLAIEVCTSSHPPTHPLPFSHAVCACACCVRC